MAENAKSLGKKLARLKTDLYGWGGAATMMRNYKPESSKYQRAKKRYDEIKPQYDALLKQVNEAKAAEKAERDKESSAKRSSSSNLTISSPSAKSGANSQLF